MSAFEQNYRFNFKTSSELPDVIADLKTITGLIQQQAVVAASSANEVRAIAVKQRSDEKAAADESLAISKELIRQTTLEKKAALEQQTTQLRASEAQNTAYVKAAEQERATIAREIAKQTTQEQAAELKRREVELKAAEDRQTAAVRAALLEQAQIAEQLREQETAQLRQELNQQTATYKAELNQQTIAAKAEADERVIAFRNEQQRETMLLRGELAEQRTLLKSQGGAYQELRGFIASAFGVYEVIDFTRQIITAKSQVDVFRTGLQQMIGSKKEADEVFVKLVEMAKQTPFGADDLQKATFSLKAMGVATQELLPTLDMLGNLAAVAGTDKLPLISKAYTDIMSKGKLMKQETNQLTEWRFQQCRSMDSVGC